MALRHKGKNTTTTRSNIMSSSNNSIYSSNGRSGNGSRSGNGGGQPSGGNGGLSGGNGGGHDHTIFIGKDAHSGIPSRKLATSSAPVWKKKNTFDQLVAVLRAQSSSHSIADLISALTGELPINAGNAYAEALSVRELVIRQRLSVNHLEGVEFIDGDGDAIVVKEADVSKRPADMRYFRFNCTMNGSFADSSVHQDNLTVQFSLRLPQTVKGQQPVGGNNDDAGMDDTCRRLFGRKISSDESKEQEGTAGVDVDTREDEVREARKNTTTTPDKSKQGFSAVASPKMDRLLDSNGSKAGEILLSYYGELDFIDNQSAFDRVFGKNPELLPATAPHLLILFQFFQPIQLFHLF